MECICRSQNLTGTEFFCRVVKDKCFHVKQGQLKTRRVTLRMSSLILAITLDFLPE